MRLSGLRIDLCSLLLVALCEMARPCVASPSFQQIGDVLVMSNANVQLNYHLSSGAADFLWRGAKKITGFYSGVTLSSGYVKGTNYASWSWAVVSSNQAAVTANGNGHPTMTQYFTLDQTNSFLVRVDVSGTALSANWMGPVVVDWPGGVDLGSANDNRALYVPFDNDHFVRYNAMSINTTGTSYEVGAFYDNATRAGLVVGSVTHDTWKGGVHWSGSNNKLDKLNVFGGASSSTATWDVMPHGSVTGNTISSPTVYVGFGSDWRDALEAFAEENKLFVPKLVWTNGVPFGWNSWGYYQSQISYPIAIGVSDSIHTNLQAFGFNNGGTVYVNLDSYWNNLDDAHLLSFSTHCHNNGQKAGVYWAPFVWWGSSVNATSTVVEGTGGAYRYSDVLLRTSSGGFQTNDGALAMDPTHAGTQQRTSYYANRFITDGFDYIKLDFLSHGALEGVHFDPAVTTGIQAFNQGMRYVWNALGGRMFVSLSIAPLFPYQYSHSRRIACDAQQSRISNTEYTMNSVSYGWWLDRLYSFNDPDIMVFANGADSNEAQSRLLSGVVTGLMLDGDNLTNASSIATAQSYLTNAALNAVARSGQSFRPVEGNTGSSAATLLVSQQGPLWYVAVFNYSSGATNLVVDLTRAGPGSATYLATDLWSGAKLNVTNGLAAALNPKQSKLFQLSAVGPIAFTSATVAGTNLVLTFSGGPGNCACRVLASAKLAASPAGWDQVATGSFDSTGSGGLTLAILSGEPQTFLRLVVP